MKSVKALERTQIKSMTESVKLAPISPYLAPVKGNSRDTQFTRDRKRVKTFGYINKEFLVNQSVVFVKKIKQDQLSKTIKNNESHILETEPMLSVIESDNEILDSLNERLSKVQSNGFHEKLKVFFDAFDQIANHNTKYAKVLVFARNGLVDLLKGYYKNKNKRLKESLSKISENLLSLKKEKENLIGKLNTLSSENINLLNANEDLLQKLKQLKSFIPSEVIGKQTPIEFISRVNEKDQVIKNLSLKLNEMTLNENKLLGIIEKIHTGSASIQNIYVDTASKSPFLKHRRNLKIPTINLDLLER